CRRQARPDAGGRHRHPQRPRPGHRRHAHRLAGGGNGHPGDAGEHLPRDGRAHGLRAARGRMARILVPEFRPSGRCTHRDQRRLDHRAGSSRPRPRAFRNRAPRVGAPEHPGARRSGARAVQSAAQPRGTDGRCRLIRHDQQSQGGRIPVNIMRISLALSALLIASPVVAADNSITVWADATRQPAVEAFEAAHPEIKVNLVVDDGSSGASGTFQTKIALADQAGSGWPDVVFSTQNNDASWVSQETNGVQAFAQVLSDGFLDKGFLEGYTPGAEDPVTVDGKVYGLRNDLAPVLFWYNKDLLTKFGYDVPKTWEDYQAL